jgi:DNA-binding transcriptional ArsR family regulator
MIELELGAADVARVRFARSPMDELVQSLRVLGGCIGNGMHTRWEAMARSRLASQDLSLVDTLVSGSNYLPDFLMPPPQRWDTTFEFELGRVRESTVDDVRASLDRCWPETELPQALRPLYENPVEELGPLADLLTDYWDAAIAPVWERLCAVHDADLSYRSAALTSGGVAALFADLHPWISYADDRLSVRLPNHDRVHRVNGAGVLLVPCVFVWPRLTVFDDDPYQPAIAYPARGVGEVWAEPLDHSGAPVADLIGRGRAAVLALLDLPQSTTQLAARLGVAPSTVSEHLAILRRSRLVRSHRSGKTVLYERTDLAVRLLD